MRRLSTSAFVFLLAAPVAAFAQSAPGAGVDSGGIDFALLDRPMTLEASQIEVNARFDHLNLSDDLAGDLSQTGLVLGAAVGLSDIAEVGLESGFVVDPEAEWSEQIALRGLVTLYDSRDVDLGLAVIAPIDFAEGADRLPAIQLGAPVRMRIGDRFALFFGHNLLRMGLGANDYASADVNVGFGVQLAEPVALRLDTRVASIALAGEGDASSSVNDVLPVALNAVVGLGALDVYAGASMPNLGGDGADVVFINGGALVRF